MVLKLVRRAFRFRHRVKKTKKLFHRVWQTPITCELVSKYSIVQTLLEEEKGEIGLELNLRLAVRQSYRIG
jgi:hypothetical protein